MIQDLLKALIDVAQLAIQVYIIIIVIRSFLSWAGHVPPNRLIFFLRKITDPVFRFVHKHLPFTIIGGIDISPIIIIFFLYLLNNLLTRWANYILLSGG
ncbi:MAG: YggT family protein [Acidobacteriota bacterium]